MRTLVAAILAIVLSLTTTTTAQKPSFTPYGKACPSTTRPLAVSGLPKLGTSFTVSGISFPGGCTRKFCPCPCCDCNTCFGSVLLLGLTRLNVTLPPGCKLLTSPDIMLTGGVRGQVTFPVPNNPALIGARFYMQRMDVRLQEVRGTQCATTYRPLGFVGFSNGVAGVGGL